MRHLEFVIYKYFRRLYTRELGPPVIARDRETRESKGVGYVKFTKPSIAALAIETCDKSLKAVIAEPKSSNLKQQKLGKKENVMSAAPMEAMPVNHFMDQDSFNFSVVHDQSNPGWVTLIMHNGKVKMIAAQAAVTEGIANHLASSFSNKRLFVIVSPTVTHDQISSLFDLIPGMEYCDLKHVHDHNTHESRGIAYVMYKSVGYAICAKEKLNGFEYPPGSRLVVKFAEENTSSHNGSKSTSTGAHMAAVNPMVFNTIETPTSFYQASSATNTGTTSPYTTAVLPNPQPFAEVAARLFIVCQPRAPPEQVLKDVFSRFGNLIDIWMVGDRNFGYAKFSSKLSADAAISSLNLKRDLRNESYGTSC